MTKYYSYILGLLSAVSAFTSCSQEEVDYYDKNYNGIYFNYESEEDLNSTVNFADYVLDDPSEIEQTLKLNLLGYISDTDRRFVLKTREAEGYPLANVTIIDNILPAGEYELDAKYKVGKPEKMDVVYAAEIYLDPTDANSDLGEGNEGFDKYIVYVKETYSEPNGWNYPAGSYLGVFSAEKYKLLVKISGKTDFYTYANWQNTYASEAVDQVRAYNKEHPDAPSAIDLPFYYDKWDPIEYSKPDYWNEDYTTYVGKYSTSSFVSLANSLGATTANESSVFPNDEDGLKELNKAAMLSMMQSFNDYSNAPSEFKQEYPTIKMFDDMDYDVIQPSCWKETDEWGDTNYAYSYVTKYYGEYSDEKYKFMIKTWAAYTDNTEDFVFVQLFPVYSGWKEDWSGMEAKWDEDLGGETAIKECLRVIKAEYDKNPNAYSFTFPDVE